MWHDGGPPWRKKRSLIHHVWVETIGPLPFFLLLLPLCVPFSLSLSLTIIRRRDYKRILPLLLFHWNRRRRLALFFFFAVKVAPRNRRHEVCVCASVMAANDKRRWALDCRRKSPRLSIPLLEESFQLFLFVPGRDPLICHSERP